jgi:divalent metal cation (Fe/Co/Zn/Cd) transporter
LLLIDVINHFDFPDGDRIFGAGASCWKGPRRERVRGNHRGKDPAVFTVFLEDSASLVGTGLAFLGIFPGQSFHDLYIDPAASILIGLLLASVAALSGRETGAFLLAERTNRAKSRKFKQVISTDRDVESAGDLLTRKQALLKVEIRFRRALNIRQLESAIDRIKRHTREQEPTVDKIFIDADSLETNP